MPPNLPYQTMPVYSGIARGHGIVAALDSLTTMKAGAGKESQRRI